MRIVYLCTVDPPPPKSDWEVVQDFFINLPEHLRPRTKTESSPHYCYFADRIGSNWLPEFHDFAIAFVSKNFLANENALRCLRRAQTAFPNMVAIDIHNNLSDEEQKIIYQYAKNIFTPDEGTAFLLNVFPEIAAAYDLERKEFVKTLESEGYDYLSTTISDLEKRSKKNHIVGWICYASSFLFLLLILSFTYIRFNNYSNFDNLALTVSNTIFLCVEIVALSILAISITRFLFVLGKSFTVEGIRCADRAHAIGLGRLYLKLYKDNFKWEELKDVLNNWNIDGGSEFRNMDAKVIEPVSLDRVASMFGNSK